MYLVVNEIKGNGSINTSPRVCFSVNFWLPVVTDSVFLLFSKAIPNLPPSKLLLVVSFSSFARYTYTCPTFIFWGYAVFFSLLVDGQQQ